MSNLIDEARWKESETDIIFVLYLFRVKESIFHKYMNTVVCDTVFELRLTLYRNNLFRV